ncbi:hypothetical protein BHE74_00018107 [Ensete ventricosum]|nr:hypothetical protein BHE74_00018107 [Ensete ventricosum]RZR94460.1 hypothetical protein BHM03_00023146 [Ensete ventricosum]
MIFPSSTLVNNTATWCRDSELNFALNLRIKSLNKFFHQLYLEPIFSLVQEALESALVFLYCRSLADFGKLSINVLVLQWSEVNQELSLELSPRRDSVIRKTTKEVGEKAEEVEGEGGGDVKQGIDDYAQVEQWPRRDSNGRRVAAAAGGGISKAEGVGNRGGIVTVDGVGWGHRSRMESRKKKPRVLSMRKVEKGGSGKGKSGSGEEDDCWSARGGDSSWWQRQWPRRKKEAVEIWLGASNKGGR